MSVFIDCDHGAPPQVRRDYALVCAGADVQQVSVSVGFVIAGFCLSFWSATLIFLEFPYYAICVEGYLRNKPTYVCTKSAIFTEAYLYYVVQNRTVTP